MEYRDSMIAHTYAAWTTQSALYLLLSENSGYSHIQGINANTNTNTKYITNTSMYILTSFRNNLFYSDVPYPYRTCQTAQVHRTVRTREVGVAVECSSSGSSRVGRQQGVRL